LARERAPCRFAPSLLGDGRPDGIQTIASTVSKCAADSNVGFGIYAQEFAVSHSAANYNGITGIVGGTVTGSSASYNGSVTGGGIVAFSVSHCFVGSNKTGGIGATGGSVTHSTANFNGGDGIDALNGTVTSCQALGNENHGIIVLGGVIAFSSASQNTTNLEVGGGGSRTGNVPAP